MSFLEAMQVSILDHPFYFIFQVMIVICVVAAHSVEMEVNASFVLLWHFPFIRKVIN